MYIITFPAVQEKCTTDKFGDFMKLEVSGAAKNTAGKLTPGKSMLSLFIIVYEAMNTQMFILLWKYS